MKLFTATALTTLLTLALLTSCREIEMTQSIEIDTTPSEVVPISDWSMSKSEVKSNQSDEFKLVSEQPNCLIYEYGGNDDDITQAYSFSNEGRLQTSVLMLAKNSSRVSEAKKVLDKYDERGTKGNVQVYSAESINTAATYQELETANGKTYVTIGFSEYTPSASTDDPDAPYVDLGLSVCWAKCNVGAESPEEAGTFFAWSETSPKETYWRENYEFCSTNDGYVFNYHNPLEVISGSEYDAATKHLGDDWHTPTMEEANELIHLCTWTESSCNGVKGYTVTGPNGNSIFLPNTPYKYQDKERKVYEIWTGTSLGKDENEAYIIKFPVSSPDNKPTLNSYWKAWGHAIRPVYNPKF